MIRPITNFEQWERRRATLSHDVVKNELTPAVSKLANILSGAVEDSEFEESFLPILGGRIDEVLDELRELAGCAETALSPRQFFRESPLSGLDADTRDWLPHVVHEEWSRQVRLPDATERLLGETRRVQERLADLRQFWHGATRARKERAEALRDALRGLSTALGGMAAVLPCRSWSSGSSP